MVLAFYLRSSQGVSNIRLQILHDHSLLGILQCATAVLLGFFCEHIRIIQ